jgi:hypothetical protein
VSETTNCAALDASDISDELGTWIAIGRHLAQCPSVVDPEEFGVLFAHMTVLHRRLEAALEAARGQTRRKKATRRDRLRETAPRSQDGVFTEAIQEVAALWAASRPAERPVLRLVGGTDHHGDPEG